MEAIIKYPRTHHIEGSRLQPGDEDLDCVSFKELRGLPLVVEEKVDGANAGLRFDPTGRLLLQSRGHYLTGGPRERHFNLFKQWANAHYADLWDLLGSRYVMYGEWLYAKHTIFYDALPHYFMEFDVYDTEAGVFLSTARRRALLEGGPVVSVRVLEERRYARLEELVGLVGRSAFKSERWYERMLDEARSRGQDPARTLAETDLHSEMEGLYLKWEEDGVVKGRYKFVRASFHAALAASGSHWQSRPILPNVLAPSASLGVALAQEGE